MLSEQMTNAFVLACINLRSGTHWVGMYVLKLSFVLIAKVYLPVLHE